jgi:hypothetical protein
VGRPDGPQAGRGRPPPGDPRPVRQRHHPDENKRNWWGADYLSAKSANSFGVRRQLRNRSRYEVSNNPYLFGVVNNNADDLIGDRPDAPGHHPGRGVQPRGRAGVGRLVRRGRPAEKLRTWKLAKTVDGEGFLVLKTVEDLEHPVKLYPCDVEADQVTTPAPANLTELWVDGLTLHPVTGRPTHYHVLRHHPGDFFFPDLNPLASTGSRPARVHWFPKFRPGQVRGVPVFTPSLDLFAELRAFRRAVLGPPRSRPTSPPCWSRTAASGRSPTRTTTPSTSRSSGCRSTAG